MTTPHKHTYEVSAFGAERTVHKLTCRCGDVKWSGCKVMRRFVVRRSSMNLDTGATTPLDVKTVEQLCATPLFDDAHKHTGVCAGCASGWEVDENRFANEEERITATSAGSAREGQPS